MYSKGHYNYFKYLVKIIKLQCSLIKIIYKHTDTSARRNGRSPINLGTIVTFFRKSFLER